MPSPEFDKFVKTVSAFSPQITLHSSQSWAGIPMNLQEPQIIRQYLLGNGVGVDYLNHNLAPILSTASYQVKFASVFIHQKPRIQRDIVNNVCQGDTPGCELGDLLVIFCLLDRNKVPTYKSAVIAQAKKSAHLTSRSQQCLYDSDIRFEMPARVCQHSVIPTSTRFLPGYTEGRTKALHYLILEGRPKLRQVPWAANLEYSYTHFLCRILMGDLGLEFQDVPTPPNPDWDCIMQDLLDVGGELFLVELPEVTT